MPRWTYNHATEEWTRPNGDRVWFNRERGRFCVDVSGVPLVRGHRAGETLRSFADVKHAKAVVEARHLGMSDAEVTRRINAGWSVDRALGRDA